MRIEHRLEIEAGVDTVWELTLDVESWPNLTSTMESVERLDTGPLKVGSKARVKQPGQAAKVWTVTQLDDRETFAWSTKWLGMTMTGIHRLRGSNDRTINILAVEIEGGPTWLLGGLLRRPILSSIAQENEGFKTVAEAEGSLRP